MCGRLRLNSSGLFSVGVPRVMMILMMMTVVIRRRTRCARFTYATPTPATLRRRGFRLRRCSPTRKVSSPPSSMRSRGYASSLNGTW